MEDTNPILSDWNLLQQYASTGSNPAFAELVRRYVDLVYFTSLRRVRNPHLAEDVSQAVFFVLARKAGKIPAGTIVAGWLYQTAKFIAADALKMERRRQQHEQIAAMNMPTQINSDQTWTSISPLLEAAMDRLSRADRDILLLRYFQGMAMAEVAQAAGMQANTVAKRIERALEKLRTYFADHGVAAPAGVVSAAMAVGASQHAPSALAAAAALPATIPSAATLSLGRGVTSGFLTLRLTLGAIVAALCLGMAIYRTAILMPVAGNPPLATVRPATPATQSVPDTRAAPEPVAQTRPRISAPPWNGVVQDVRDNQKMFAIIAQITRSDGSIGRVLVHIQFSDQTVFTHNGQPSTAAEVLQAGHVVTSNHSPRAAYVSWDDHTDESQPVPTQ